MSKHLFLPPALIAGFGLILAGRAAAQTFTTLYSFTATAGHPRINSDGANPYAALVLSATILYGTAIVGGSSGWGTVFALNTNGTGFTNLYSFTAKSDTYPYDNSDGSGPHAGLILSGNTLYGTAGAGGSSGEGTVFSLNTDGSGFTTLHSFTWYGSDGGVPLGGVILSGNTLYGTASGGGSSGNGTVFALNTNGTGFTNLYSFKYSGTNLSGYYTTNSDGANPYAGLILSGNTLYGTAVKGGGSGNGTVFALNTDGTGFTNLHTFTGGSDGAWPYAGLILSGNTLYGTASQGGSSGYGTVFSLSLTPPPVITAINWSREKVTLAWSSVTNGIYRVEYKPSLAATDWTALTPDVMAAGDTASFTDSPGVAMQRFYRIVLLP